MEDFDLVDIKGNNQTIFLVAVKGKTSHTTSLDYTIDCSDVFSVFKHCIIFMSFPEKAQY